MATTGRKITVYFLMGLTALLFSSCQNLCQQPPTQPLTSFVNQQWRLVSTTDPSAAFQGLNNYNTLIFEWNPDFSGDVYRLQYNTELTTPALTFVYQVNSSSNIMQVQYTAASSDTSGDGTDGSTGTTTTGATGSSTAGQTVQYSYQLSTELDLTDTQKGYTYRLVPFDGIVLPDQTCTF